MSRCANASASVLKGEATMGLSPDAIFELFLPAQPPTDQIAEIIGFVQNNLPVPVQQPEPVWNPDNNVLTIGFWIATDGFTEDQLKASLRASSFISGTGMETAGLFISTAVIQRAADLGWSQQPKRVGTHPGFITFANNINVEVSSAGIVTKVNGSYHPEVLPSVGFAYTISDSFTLNQSGEGPPLKSNESTHLQLSTLGVIEEAFLIGLLQPILGNVVFFGGLLGAGGFDPHAPGAGAQVADNWPGTVLTPISPPLTGKVIFTWGKLNVDDSGIRTLGTWNLAVRSPQVQIVGPRALSFKVTQPGAVGHYFPDLTDLRNGVTVVWGGEAEGGDFRTMVQFDTPGVFSIQVSVTDVDNMSATGATNVLVTETRDGHGEPP